MRGARPKWSGAGVSSAGAWMVVRKIDAVVERIPIPATADSQYLRALLGAPMPLRIWARHLFEPSEAEP